jgi:hypothetical protein
MKLYAKTTSERASKGQGGKWIEIDILDERKQLVYMLSIKNEIHKPEMRVYYDIDLAGIPEVKGEYLSQAINMAIPKGKQQEMGICVSCDKDIPKGSSCDNCFPAKGKQQKGNKCDQCKGIGNLDEGAGFPLDCLNCKGTGWIE